MRIGALQRVEVDLADGTVVGADLRLQAIGQDSPATAFPAPSADSKSLSDSSSKISMMLESPASEVERRCVKCGRPFICDFDRNRDLLLDFFGGAAGPLRDHLDVVIGNVGIGFDRKIVKRNRAPDQQQQCPRPAPGSGCSAQNRRGGGSCGLLLRRACELERLGYHLLARLQAR